MNIYKINDNITESKCRTSFWLGNKPNYNPFAIRHGNKRLYAFVSLPLTTYRLPYLQITEDYFLYKAPHLLPSYADTHFCIHNHHRR